MNKEKANLKKELQLLKNNSKKYNESLNDVMVKGEKVSFETLNQLN